MTFYEIINRLFRWSQVLITHVTHDAPMDRSFRVIVTKFSLRLRHPCRCYRTKPTCHIVTIRTLIPLQEAKYIPTEALATGLPPTNKDHCENAVNWKTLFTVILLTQPRILWVRRTETRGLVWWERYRTSSKEDYWWSTISSMASQWCKSTRRGEDQRT